MSTIEAEVRTPWVGSKSYKKHFSITVVSSNIHIVDKISEALTEIHSQGGYAWHLQILRCVKLSDVLKDVNITGNVSIDFVVIALDTSKTFCLEWAEFILAEVHPDLMRRRVVLVNATGLSLYEMAVDGGDILTLQDEKNLDLFNANVFSDKEALLLSRNLLTYFEGIVGVKTGIPNLNI